MFVFPSVLASLSHLADRPVTVSEQQREWVCLLSSTTAGLEDKGSVGGASAPQNESLRWAGQALVSMADRKWSEAKDAIGRSELVHYRYVHRVLENQNVLLYMGKHVVCLIV